MVTKLGQKPKPVKQKQLVLPLLSFERLETIAIVWNLQLLFNVIPTRKGELVRCIPLNTLWHAIR